MLFDAVCTKRVNFLFKGKQKHLSNQATINVLFAFQTKWKIYPVNILQGILRSKSFIAWKHTSFVVLIVPRFQIKVIYNFSLLYVAIRNNKN